MLSVVHKSGLLVQSLRLMLRKKYGCLPVVNDKGKLVGTVTETDATRLTERLVRDMDRAVARAG